MTKLQTYGSFSSSAMTRERSRHNWEDYFSIDRWTNEGGAPCREDGPAMKDPIRRASLWKAKKISTAGSIRKTETGRWSDS
jgi:hypothetical protein